MFGCWVDMRNARQEEVCGPGEEGDESVGLEELE